LERRAIQLGLRGRMLAQYEREWTLDIEDITPFVRDQAEHIRPPEARQGLMVPTAAMYRPADDEVSAHIGLSLAGGAQP
jgi:hypothetical protein